MKEVLYEVRCLKSNEDMILALIRQFKQLSHEPEKLEVNFSGSRDNCLNCPVSARIISSFDFKHRTSYNTSFIINLLVGVSSSLHTMTEGEERRPWTDMRM